MYRIISIVMFFFASVMAEVPLIPRTVLFDNPQRAQVSLSPQGTYIAYCAPYNGVMNIYIQRRDSYKGFQEARVLTHEKEAVRSYFWSFDETTVFFARDNNGDENTRLFAIDLKTNQVSALTPQGVKARLTSYNEKHPDVMLIAMNKNNPAVFDLYELHLKTQACKLLEECPDYGLGWVIDNDLNLRFLFGVTPTGGKQLLVKKEGAWVPWIVWDTDDALSAGPWFFSEDNQYLYCEDSRGCDVAQLVKIHATTGEKTVVAYDPAVDISSCVLQPHTHKLQAVSWVKDREVLQFFDEEYKKLYHFLCTIDSGECTIISRTLDDNHWIVAFEKDNGPVTYYYYNKQAKTTHLLGDNKPALREYTLSNVEPMSYTTRDGLTVHGYITYPHGVARERLPLVLYVHGGPWLRDTWGYDPTIQWFANRGYICLQVNYRGSLGYGKKFLDAGNKQWSRGMHNDLVDAVDWAVKKGIADPAKIAIYGGSYGGYAALVGATHTPDLFCCAVDIVGPSNLLTFINSIPPYWQVFLQDMYKRVGHPVSDAEFLKACSPLFHVDKIKIPLFIAQGANDPRVKQAESEQIVAALKEKNIPHTYMLFHDEGHGFAKPQNRLKFMAAAEKFLAENLGGRCEQ